VAVPLAATIDREPAASAVSKRMKLACAVITLVACSRSVNPEQLVRELSPSEAEALCAALEGIYDAETRATESKVLCATRARLETTNLADCRARSEACAKTAIVPAFRCGAFERVPEACTLTVGELLACTAASKDTFANLDPCTDVEGLDMQMRVACLPVAMCDSNVPWRAR
jgi:hypothetical protein